MKGRQRHLKVAPKLAEPNDMGTDTALARRLCAWSDGAEHEIEIGRDLATDRMAVLRYLEGGDSTVGASETVTVRGTVARVGDDSFTGRRFRPLRR